MVGSNYTMSVQAAYPVDSLQRGTWEALPQELLARVADFLMDRNGTTSALATLRLTCRQWCRSIDKNHTQLKLRGWPNPCPAVGVLSGRFSCVRALDLRRCRMQQAAHSASGVCDILMVGSSGGSYAPFAEQCCDNCSSPSEPESAASQPAAQQSSPVVHAEAADQPASSGQKLLAGPMLGNQAALTSFIAARYPEALPCAVPVAAEHIWQELPRLHTLQHLAINGSMLLVRSLRSSMQEPRLPDQDTEGLVDPAVITHVYTLQLPDVVCQIRSLRSLAVEWCIAEPEAGSSLQDIVFASSSSNSLIIPGRRRSYDVSPAPTVNHLADPWLQLPAQLHQLTNLQNLTLAASFKCPTALAPLLGLSQLQGLALGPGELDVRALVPLAQGGVLLGVQRLVLQQQGPWNAAAFVAVLRDMRQLQHLEVVEYEITRHSPDAVLPPEQHLIPEHLATVAASLHTVTWTTCSQRLCQGSSLLGRTSAGSTDTAAAAAGSWIGGCTALQRLQLAGCSGTASRTGAAHDTHSPRLSVLSAPVLEVLSPSIGQCKGLEVLELQGLGVPLLPACLAHLQQLQRVTIASTRLARRAVHRAEVALAVLGSCKGLRDLTLAGCELRSLPAWLSGLQGLSSLDLQGNYLQDLPGHSLALGLPAGLQVLNLSDNRLREIPEGLGELSRLEKLVVDENYLCSLPEQIWQLPALKELSVQENMLQRLPEIQIITSGWGSSSSLNSNRSSFDCCSIRSSSSSRMDVDWVEQDQGLMRAYSEAAAGELTPEDETLATATGTILAAAVAAGTAAAAKAARGPACISGDLKFMNLAGNQLLQLPAGICMLTALQHLDLSHNQLRILPEDGSIWMLTKLTALQLSHNHLKKLPVGMSNLQRLVELDLSGNHLPATAASSRTSSEVRPAVTATVTVAAVPADEDENCETTPLLAPAAAMPGLKQRTPMQSLKSKFRRRGKKKPPISEQQLPTPLRALRQLQQLRMGGQQQEHTGGHQCPLQLLLGGLVDLVEVVRSLAPPHHQCPVTKAAAAAVAHLSRISTGRRGRKERARNLAERVRFEPGWVLLPAPKGPTSSSGGMAAAGAGVGGW